MEAVDLDTDDEPAATPAPPESRFTLTITPLECAFIRRGLLSQLSVARSNAAAALRDTPERAMYEERARQLAALVEKVR